MRGFKFSQKTFDNAYFASKDGFKYEFTRNVHDIPASASQELDNQIAKQRLVPVEGDGTKYALVEQQSVGTAVTARTSYTFEVGAAGYVNQTLEIRNWGPGITGIISSLCITVDSKGVRKIYIYYNVNNTSITLTRDHNNTIGYNARVIDEETAKALWNLGSSAFYTFKSQHGIDEKIQVYSPQIRVEFELTGPRVPTQPAPSRP